MDEQILEKRLQAMEGKLDAIHVSVERTRKYFLWTLVLSVAFFLLPLVGILIAVPFLLDTLSSAYGGLL